MTAQVRIGSGGSKPIFVDFDYTDFTGGPVALLIGKMLKDVYCNSCVVDIIDAFDGGVTLTVGDMVAQGRLQIVADNFPGIVDQYETRPNYAYSVSTDVYVFLTGTPTVGSGRVVVYL